jgi:hypothetical protein
MKKKSRFFLYASIYLSTWIKKIKNRLQQGELYYLRMLLHHIPGATCYEDMRTVNSQVYPTFQAAAEALGLLECDNQ